MTMGMTNQQRLEQLVKAGWSVAQAGQIVTGQPVTATGLPASTAVVKAPSSPPIPYGLRAPTGIQAPATVQPGAPPPAGFDLSDVIGPVAATVGLGAVAVAAPLAAAYGISELIGVQYPWQTGPGEGFIAPWNRNIVQDEQGMWVTPNTRPDLFTPEKGGTMGSAAMVAGGMPMAGMGPAVVKQWSASGWPFAMTSDGRIHTVTKSGIRKSWRPYRSVVLGKRITTGQAKRAMRKLKSIRDLADDIEKLGGTRTIYRSK